MCMEQGVEMIDTTTSKATVSYKALLVPIQK